jgi:hypothetical protein
MKYDVGQILFVVLNKKGQVYPMQVIEEITKKTLKGEEKNYVLQGGADTDSKVLLDKVDGEIFHSAVEARDALISRATAQIDRLVSNAVLKSKEWYLNQRFDKESIETSEESSSYVQDKQTEQREEVIVQLPDGTKARLRPN